MRRIVLLGILVAAAWFTNCGGSSASTATVPLKTFAYVGNSTDLQLEVLSADTSTGILTLQQPFSIGSSALALAVDAGGKYLYYSDGTKLFALAIGSDGRLTTLGSGVQAGSACVGLKRTGSYLYAGCDGTIAGFKIGTDGTLTSIPGSPFAFAGTTSIMIVDPSGHVLYVADNTVVANRSFKSFKIDPPSGAISPGNGDTVYPGTVTGGAIDPTGRYLYLANATQIGGPPSGFITQYAVGSDASLTMISTIRLVVASDLLTMNPRSNVLFSSNVANDYINAYTLDGNRSPVISPYWQQFPALIKTMEIDPSGKLLFVTVSDFRGQGLFCVQVDSTGNIGSLGTVYLFGKDLISVASVQR